MVWRLGKRVCGLNPLKRFIYLISPNKIDKNFYHSLDKVLSFKNVEFFQLRLKNIKSQKILDIAKKIGEITTKYNVKLIINDNFNLANKMKADGCHLGQSDGPIEIARKIKNLRHYVS